MPELFTVNCLWIGPRLRPIEEVCLLSMLKQGHRVRLFTYDPVSNIPGGVERADAEDILPKNELLKHRRRQSYALATDVFRYRLQEHGLGLWLDLDILLLKPLEKVEGLLLGRQDTKLCNGAVLYFDRDHPVLHSLLDFVKDPYPIPPFYSLPHRYLLAVRKAVGRPQHVEEMKWGVFGPNAMTHFLKHHGCEHLAHPIDAFYPVPFYNAHGPLTKDWDTEAFFTPRTQALHLWNEMLRRPSKLRPHATSLYVEKGSFLETFARTELGYQFPENV